VVLWIAPPTRGVATLGGPWARPSRH